MIQNFAITCKFPGQNEIIAASRRHYLRYADMKRRYSNLAAVSIKRAGIKPMVSADIHFVWIENNRARNPDNIGAGAKFILDALVNTKIFENDGWSQITSIKHTFVVSTGPPGVNVFMSGKGKREKKV